MNLPDEQHPFEWNQVASEREQKKNILTHFFENDGLEYIDGVPRSNTKFLYLYGEENTGKLTLLKEVAKEVLGANWESKVYLRIDDGQRYPYKLHAHKVESSRKVILLTNKRAHWLKWKELYPSTKTFFFQGQEITSNPDGTLLIQYDRYVTGRQNAATQFKSSLETVLQEYLVQEGLTEEIKRQIHGKIKELFCEFLRTEYIVNYEGQHVNE